MKIIAVSYVANMGKSQTIQMTYHKFKPKYLPKILLEDINNNDITIISEVTFDFRLIRVGFASGGDCSDIVEQNLEVFEQYKCDVALMATRSYATQPWRTILERQRFKQDEVIFIQPGVIEDYNNRSTPEFSAPKTNFLNPECINSIMADCYLALIEYGMQNC